jgi:AcrR family transcriptional regulator
MPRAFSERERDTIRGQLQAAAREAFRAHGVRRTNVDDLARSAGISKGAFYLFYPSKEALMLELLLQLEAVFREYFARKIDASPRQALHDLLVATLELHDTEPLLERLAQDDAPQLLRGLPDEQRTALATRDLDFLIDMLQRLTRAGLDVGVEPPVLLGLLRGLFFVSLHREQIGSEVFPQVQHLLVEALSVQLMGDTTRA